ncbi:hypothetical protein ILYODFUR_025493 [Ilyodon furcidens]|uniref:Uncharacterized protein n=1 Tax=Ilyodon furcidens TaxID=33524 RepID=A0ABV0T041_9TELE
MSFSQGSGFLLFNILHVFSISGKRCLGDSPNRQSATCLNVSEDIGKAEAMATASERQGQQVLENIRKVVSIKTRLRTDILISFPGEDIISSILCCSGRVSL